MYVKFKNFYNRHIMLDFQTIKTDFLFENSQDFNQTTHARPQPPIVFIHNISLYFNCISSVKYLFKWSRHSHVMPFSVVQPKHSPKKSETREKYKCIITNSRFFALFKFKNGGLQCRISRRFRKVFFVSISYVISCSNSF